MRRSRSLLVSSVLSLFVAACGGSKSGGGKQDGGNGLPDGFLSDGCANATDCDDGDPCTEDRCVNKKCTYRGVDCSEMTDGCNVGVCDPSDGSCGTVPANDDAVCQTVDGDPGTCTSGFCQAAPQCYVDGYFSCGYTTSDDNSTTGSSVVDDYQCVQGLTGPEYAYDFYASTDKHVKVTMTSTADLDLIVLKGTKCVGAAECVASASTAGSGNETLEFDAKAGDDYVIVVDGRNGAKGSYSIAIECEGCKPKQTLTCNQTVMGDTTSATATTTVGGLYCMEGPGGPEEVYNVQVPVGTRMKVTLSGASTEHDLIAFEDADGKCGDPYCTEYSVNDNPGNDVVTLETSEYADSDKWSVVVDAREKGGTYMLQVDCPVICATGGGTLSCSSGKITKRSDSAGSTSVIDAYSCAGATGYTGAEMIYEFSPYQSGSYTIDLTGLDADLDLLVIEGDGYYSDAVCDPTALCKTSSVNTGTTAESVTFDADSSKMYYIIIDGKAGAAGNYSLKLNSTQCPAPSCYTSSNKLGCSWVMDARASNDPDRSKNLIDTWACGTDMTGSEVIYQLPIDKDGTYEVALTDAPTGINMFVIKGTSSTCSTTTTCESVVNKKATLNAKSGDYYYVVIDGKNGLNANYKVTMTSTACGVPTCKDSIHDLNCTTTKSYAGRSDAVGATRNVNQWTCSTSDKYTAAEYAHGFAPPKTGLYTVKLTNLSADLDLMVIEVDSWGCLPAANCAVTSMGGSTKAISALRGTADETVTFYGKSDKKYYFIIDGYAPAGEEVVSDYVIFMSSCAP